jgi:quercetin dioxygenase-like cupin family protein
MAAIAAFAQGPKVVPEGRGLLPRPSAATPEAPPTSAQFQPDPSAGFSRTVFVTDEDPDFNITIRDFSFPPDKQTHTVTLPSAAFIHLLGGTGKISVAKKQVDLSSVARTTVPASAPIDVVNDAEYPVVIRALIVEAK